MGRVLVVDYSDPADPTDLGEVDIPGTYQILDVAVQGNQALVVGRTGGDAGPDTNGTMTLSVLDITDPSNPQLVGTTLVTNAQFPTNASGVTKISAVGLGNGLFAVSEAEVNGNPELLVVDPSDPNNIVASYMPVTAYVNEMAVSGNTALRHQLDQLAGPDDFQHRPARNNPGDGFGRSAQQHRRHYRVGLSQRGGRF